MRKLPRTVVCFGLGCGILAATGSVSWGEQVELVFPEMPDCAADSVGSAQERLNCIADFADKINEAFDDIERFHSDIGDLRNQLDAALAALSAQDGMVAAFNLADGCPVSLGWTPYYQAGGRFIIGAGPHGRDEGTRHQATHQDDNETEITYLSRFDTGDEGGRDYLWIRPGNLPPHGHQVWFSRGHAISSGSTPIEIGTGEPLNIVTGLLNERPETQVLGEDAIVSREPRTFSSPDIDIDPARIEILPPFVALQFCIFDSDKIGNPIYEDEQEGAGN